MKRIHSDNSWHWKYTVNLSLIWFCSALSRFKIQCCSNSFGSHFIKWNRIWRNLNKCMCVSIVSISTLPLKFIQSNSSIFHILRWLNALFWMFNIFFVVVIFPKWKRKRRIDQIGARSKSTQHTKRSNRIQTEITIVGFDEIDNIFYERMISKFQLNPSIVSSFLFDVTFFVLFQFPVSLFSHGGSLLSLLYEWIVYILAFISSFQTKKKGEWSIMIVFKKTGNAT